VFIIPALTLLFGVDIRYAIGASIVSVIATSSGAAAAYVRERMTDLRIGTFLQVAASAGALAGASLAGRVAPRFLFATFGVAMAASALAMFWRRRDPIPDEVHPDALARRLRLGGRYFDRALGREVPYRAGRAGVGFALMVLGGVVSGLLGIGAGGVTVLAMDLGMRLPIKVSTATSNFMIGVTAASGAAVYLARGDVNPFIVAPVAVGVTVGALVGSRLLGRLGGPAVRAAFAAVLLWLALQMLLRGVG
jgi:uncharacterized membrane protein YfcA